MNNARVFNMESSNWAMPAWLSLLAIITVISLSACAGRPSQTNIDTRFDSEPQQPLRDTLKDGSPGPEMVVVPAGSFVMGSPQDEAGRYANEGPQHQVTFAQSFAIGRAEISVAEFRQFVEASGYVTNAERGEGSFFRDPASGNWHLKPSLNWKFDSAGQPAGAGYPVVHVSWEDAQAYAQWLSAQTGQQYRLPSEAELEYVNRAGSQTPYWWGKQSPTKPVANIKGENDRPFTDALLWDHTADEKQYAFREGETELFFSGYQDGHGKPAPVASFLPNAFGLYDTAGNVWEWAEDCWHANYQQAPSDGSAWVDDGNCDTRVVRGGSWYCYPRHIRSANRWARWPIFRNMYIGFRVARQI